MCSSDLLIYKENDFAGLFLIKERIKQIVYRLKSIYGVDVYSKNFRAYLPKEKRKMIYVESEGPLRIGDNFDIQAFMNFYDISQSKAKKIIPMLISKNIISKKLISGKNIYQILK